MRSDRGGRINYLQPSQFGLFVHRLLPHNRQQWSTFRGVSLSVGISAQWASSESERSEKFTRRTFAEEASEASEAFEGFEPLEFGVASAAKREREFKLHCRAVFALATFASINLMPREMSLQRQYKRRKSDWFHLRAFVCTCTHRVVGDGAWP